MHQRDAVDDLNSYEETLHKLCVFQIKEALKPRSLSPQQRALKLADDPEFCKLLRDILVPTEDEVLRRVQQLGKKPVDGTSFGARRYVFDASKASTASEHQTPPVVEQVTDAKSGRVLQVQQPFPQQVYRNTRSSKHADRGEEMRSRDEIFCAQTFVPCSRRLFVEENTDEDGPPVGVICRCEDDGVESEIKPPPEQHITTSQDRYCKNCSGFLITSDKTSAICSKSEYEEDSTEMLVTTPKKLHYCRYDMRTPHVFESPAVVDAMQSSRDLYKQTVPRAKWVDYQSSVSDLVASRRTTSRAAYLNQDKPLLSSKKLYDYRTFLRAGIPPGDLILFTRVCAPWFMTSETVDAFQKHKEEKRWNSHLFHRGREQEQPLFHRAAGAGQERRGQQQLHQGSSGRSRSTSPISADAIRLSLHLLLREDRKEDRSPRSGYFVQRSSMKKGSTAGGLLVGDEEEDDDADLSEDATEVFSTPADVLTPHRGLREGVNSKAGPRFSRTPQGTKHGAAKLPPEPTKIYRYEVRDDYEWLLDYAKAGICPHADKLTAGLKKDSWAKRRVDLLLKEDSVFKHLGSAAKRYVAVLEKSDLYRKIMLDPDFQVTDEDDSDLEEEKTPRHEVPADDASLDQEMMMTTKENSWPAASPSSSVVHGRRTSTTTARQNSSEYDYCYYASDECDRPPFLGGRSRQHDYGLCQMPKGKSENSILEDCFGVHQGAAAADAAVLEDGDHQDHLLSDAIVRETAGAPQDVAMGFLRTPRRDGPRVGGLDWTGFVQEYDTAEIDQGVVYSPRQADVFPPPAVDTVSQRAMNRTFTNFLDEQGEDLHNDWEHQMLAEDRQQREYQRYSTARLHQQLPHEQEDLFTPRHVLRSGASTAGGPSVVSPKPASKMRGRSARTSHYRAGANQDVIVGTRKLLLFLDHLHSDGVTPRRLEMALKAFEDTMGFINEHKRKAQVEQARRGTKVVPPGKGVHQEQLQQDLFYDMQQDLLYHGNDLQTDTQRVDPSASASHSHPELHDRRGPPSCYNPYSYNPHWHLPVNHCWLHIVDFQARAMQEHDAHPLHVFVRFALRLLTWREAVQAGQLTETVLFRMLREMEGKKSEGVDSFHLSNTLPPGDDVEAYAVLQSGGTSGGSFRRRSVDWGIMEANKGWQTTDFAENNSGDSRAVKTFQPTVTYIPAATR
ncbi:unnamed protein product [Amoebophrya sp. A120]|nr:unnamed protein product [Amoebophrya sp. A120]|eukprot:GSA120T00007495001.1